MDLLYQVFIAIGIVLVGIAGLLLLLAVVLYVSDILQQKNTIRHNYPLIGRFRSGFEYFGNTSLLWIGKKCPLTASSVNGFIKQQSMSILPLRLVRRAI